MDLKNLNTFRVIVEEGSFTKAAARLNYTQSTITFQISQLEQELNVQLFEKIGRRMALTGAGKSLIPYVDNVFSSVEQLRLFNADPAGCRRELRIGVGETLLCYRMPPILRDFHRLAPHVQLMIQSMNCYDIRDALLHGSLDLGIFYEDVGGFGSGLRTYDMGTFSTVLTAAPETRAVFPDFVTPDRALPLPLIINEQRCIFRQMFENYLHERSILLAHTIELWSIPTIKNLVKSNMGVTFLPRFAVQEDLDSGLLVEIPVQMPDSRITAVCAHHKNKWIDPVMQLFIQLCESSSQ